ncbi:MAG TPA: glycosyltransferase [Chitinophagaceae bacterium]
MKKILYISYDGMTDPLGQSQVLPYLVGLSKEGYRFTLLSFEKKDRYVKHRKTIEDIVMAAGIEWVPLSFTTNPPMLSKFYDAVRMQRKALALHKEKQFDMVHCRSYIAADIGLKLKRKYGVKFFFDMRGFWADEKRDGGAWKDGHPIFRRVYKYYKKKEAAYLQYADYIVSLTRAGKEELLRWSTYNSLVSVGVIPCCADMDHFSVTDDLQKKQSRKKLGIAEDILVLSYLGSVGAWYMLDEMLVFFKRLKLYYPDALFLFVTHSSKDLIINKAAAHTIPATEFVIIEANREEVPVFIKASDISISFIKPVYSKISSSPTKLGEVLSMGIPVIVNSGVGDVEAIVSDNHCGIVLKEFTTKAYDEAIHHLPEMLKKNPATIRENITAVFDLSYGIQLYSEAYQKIFYENKKGLSPISHLNPA